MIKTIGDDLLYGTKQIAAFIFNDENEGRKVYHLADKAGMPTFRLAGTICARKSSLMDWISKREADHESRS